MFPLPIRIILVTASLAFGIYRTFQGDYLGYAYILAAFFLVLEYFRGGGLSLAFKAYQKQDWPKLASYIEKIKWPDLLRDSSKSYYYFFKGLLKLQADELKAAQNLLLHSLEYNFRTSHMKSVVYGVLTETYIKLKDKANAKKYLAEMKATEHRAELEEVIGELEKAITDLPWIKGHL